tara:strand:+ start:631 stop:1362 length:732 start_codon:yes stop_codon:yes gene_type:complete
MKTFKSFFTEKFYNEQLHPRFWDNQNQLDPEARETLLRIAKDVSEQAGVENLITDVQLTGSLANYNYTDYSDLDVHMLLDFKDVNDDEDLVKSSLDGKRFIWNERHDITIGGVEVEVYFQDVDEPHMASGLYSLQEGKWLREPVYDPPEVDAADVKTKAEQIERDIDRLEREVSGESKKNLKSLQAITTKIRKKISRMRKDSLDKDGEFGVGNLAFKSLRNSGHIGRIIDLDSKLYDMQFTSE